MQNGRGRGPLQYPGNLGAQLGFGQGRWIQVELLIVSGTVFDNGLEDNVAEQEGVTGQIRTSAHVRSRFLPSAHFSEMGNRSRTSRLRKWVGGSSNDSVFQNYNVEKRASIAQGERLMSSQIRCAPAVAKTVSPVIVHVSL